MILVPEGNLAEFLLAGEEGVDDGRIEMAATPLHYDGSGLLMAEGGLVDPF